MDEGDQKRHDQVKLLLDAHAAEDGEPVGQGTQGDQRPVTEKPEKRHDVSPEHSAMPGHSEMSIEYGQDDEADQDDQVIERPDPEDPADPERAQGDAAVAGLFAEQEC